MELVIRKEEKLPDNIKPEMIGEKRYVHMAVCLKDIHTTMRCLTESYLYAINNNNIGANNVAIELLQKWLKEKAKLPMKSL